MESISIGNKILEDPTRFYVIPDKHAMESISIAKKILRDTRQNCYGIHIDTKQRPQDSTGTREKCYRIHRNRKEDPRTFYGILDKNAMESISIANKILQDPIRF